MKNYKFKTSHYKAGFTLMEIVVATAIFAFVVTGVLALFNYTLKINRRSEALRQATQGMRGFVEFLAKEIRNGRVDYGFLANGSLDSATGSIGPCTLPNNVNTDTYTAQDNRLRLINSDGQHECFYFGKDDGTYIDDPAGPGPGGQKTFAAPAGKNYTLVLQKLGSSSGQALNPPNFRIEQLMFLIRPLCDVRATCTTYSGSPRIQPMVTVLIRFVATLPSGEQVPINYQTSISTNNYDF